MKAILVKHHKNPTANKKRKTVKNMTVQQLLKELKLGQGDKARVYDIEYEIDFRRRQMKLPFDCETGLNKEATK